MWLIMWRNYGFQIYMTCIACHLNITVWTVESRSATFWMRFLINEHGCKVLSYLRTMPQKWISYHCWYTHNGHDFLLMHQCFKKNKYSQTIALSLSLTLIQISEVNSLVTKQDYKLLVLKNQWFKKNNHHISSYTNKHTNPKRTL
jgi:hypothetical protein